ncbi:MAG: molecular chaperone DnaJ [Methanobacteriota archaeon]|nr:MAG: molecular chaperone DnaJ [Euryarchaeota archaeon]
MAKKEDYYKILGVSRDADQATIKKAYRKKAMEYHPDRYKGSKEEAEEKFKQLNEAYTVLSDPEQRRIYDQFGHEGLDPSIHRNVYQTDPFDFISSIFGDIFGGGFRRGGFDDFGFGRSARQTTRKTKGRDAVLDLPLTYEEVYSGTSKKVKLPYKKACNVCKGTGGAPDSPMRTCPECGGHGVVEKHSRQGMFVHITRSTCQQCKGRGQIPGKVCKTCKGKGHLEEREVITVKIPPGVDEGELIRVQGKGYPSENGGEPGDLIFRISMKPHPIFQRNGLDTYMELAIPFDIAALGGEIEVPVISGKDEKRTATLKVPSGTKVGDQLKIKGVGFRRKMRGRDSVGDGYYVITIQVPSKLTREEKQALMKFREARMKAGH